jgi:hypothetical protein
MPQLKTEKDGLKEEVHFKKKRFTKVLLAARELAPFRSNLVHVPVVCLFVGGGDDGV